MDTFRAGDSERVKLGVLSFSHKTSPLALREALAALDARKVLAALKSQGCGEAVVLSTCNRFEVYFAQGQESVVVGALSALVSAPLEGSSRLHQGADAVTHLFSVTAGLDSLVVGETEILGQVKGAYEAALGLAMTGKATNVLFQRALYVGKSVRSETGIAVGQTSVASVAVQLAETIFGELRGSEVLILGAGLMAELTAKHLQSKKVAKLVIANRTLSKAEELAGRMKAQPLAWEAFGEALQRVDIVVASTGSPDPVLTREMILAAQEKRLGRSLFIIDIAMPRDVEETVHGLEHVYLYRLEDLEAIVAENLQSRGGEIEKARKIVLDKAAEFSGWADSVAAGREMSLKHSPAASV